MGAATVEAERRLPPRRPGRVLVADDEPRIRLALRACLDLEPRVVPDSPRGSRRMASRLDRLGVHPGVADALRRTKRRLFGVSPAMHGGEEWPWTRLRHDPSEIESMCRLRADIDGPATLADA